LLGREDEADRCAGAPVIHHNVPVNSIPAPLLTAINNWREVDPDPVTRAELDGLVAEGAVGVLTARFADRLQFGTAGLRGPICAGPMGMNRVTVRRAAWGLVSYLLDTVPGAADAGLIIGYDARVNSDVFADDTARVAAALGMPSTIIDGPNPTPLLAFGITELGTAAGVMVTASHNPPQDNGYKVYLGDSAQIVPPHDVNIAGWIDRAPADVPVSGLGDDLISRIPGVVVLQPYLDALAPIDSTDVTVAYSPLHGVGGAMIQAAFKRAGLAAPVVVAEQFVPDGSFPTVHFPNPEEPGAMDMLIALAASCGADIAIANDPDADRTAAAIPQPDGMWRRLGGDELGWILADHILRTTSGDDRLVITTVVSSTLLSQMAADHGVRYAETYTGFKWIARTILDHPDDRFVFGYEQALGYLAASRPLDKDGISTAVLLASIAADAKAKGETLQQRLDGFVARYGDHQIADRSVMMPPADGKAAVDHLRANPPLMVAGHEVTETTWFEEAGLLRFDCGSAGRVQVRPSGTEPKVKVYAEAVNTDPTPLLDAVAAMLTS
jgi:phosphomannomutase